MLNLQSTMVRLRQRRAALKRREDIFTIHYGEIKTIAFISYFIANIIFTIHYGEIKTTARWVSKTSRQNLQSTMVRLRHRVVLHREATVGSYLQSTMVRLRRNRKEKSARRVYIYNPLW